MRARKSACHLAIFVLSWAETGSYRGGECAHWYAARFRMASKLSHTSATGPWSYTTRRTSLSSWPTSPEARGITLNSPNTVEKRGAREEKRRGEERRGEKRREEKRRGEERRKEKRRGDKREEKRRQNDQKKKAWNHKRNSGENTTSVLLRWQAHHPKHAGERNLGTVAFGQLHDVVLASVSVANKRQFGGESHSVAVDLLEKTAPHAERHVLRRVPAGQHSIEDHSHVGPVDAVPLDDSCSYIHGYKRERDRETERQRERERERKEERAREREKEKKREREIERTKVR